MNALFYDQWKGRAPDDDGPDGGNDDPEPSYSSGLGLRHALEEHLALGGTIQVSCWACDEAYEVVARLPPKPFTCRTCAERSERPTSTTEAA